MSELSISLSKALEGYMIAANARRLSVNTLTGYDQTFRAFLLFLDEDPAMNSIDAGLVRGFWNTFLDLTKTQTFVFISTFNTLWTWAVREGVAERHVVRDVIPPAIPRREVVPYTRADILAMLAACDRTRGYGRPGKVRCDNRRPTALRDRAIITLLVDTGLRATELCELRIYQTDLKNQRITVMGKGRKERTLPISPRTAQVIWRYLATREDGNRKAGPLFTTLKGLPLERKGLRQLLRRIGDRAGVEGVNVHRFRHTFAIEFLRNQPNVFALQRMLGHSTLEMVRRYLAIAESDVENAHRDASPVANWLL